jgi:hypothetical protein
MFQLVAPDLTAQLTTETLHAAQLLLRAPYFADGPVGIAETTPDEISAFQTVLASPQANAIFHEVYEHGTSPGRVYALCGFYFTDPELMKEEYKTALKANESATVLSGCIGSPRPMSEFLVLTSPVRLQLNGPEDSIEAWRARQTGDLAYSHGYDIMGGAYPLTLRDYGKVKPTPAVTPP